MLSYLKLKKPTKLEWILIALVALVAATVIFWNPINYAIDSMKSYPLGSNFDYIGQESECRFARVPTGSPTPASPNGFAMGFTRAGFVFGPCYKSSDYYYATDLGAEELIEKFSGSEKKVVDAGAFGGNVDKTGYLADADVRLLTFVCSFDVGPRAMEVTYVDDVKAVQGIPLFRGTDKKHLLKIEGEVYPYLKQCPNL